MMLNPKSAKILVKSFSYTEFIDMKSISAIMKVMNGLMLCKIISKIVNI